MTLNDWVDFPHHNSGFRYPDRELEMAWPVLHRGDLVEFPDQQWVQDCLHQAPQAAPEDFDGDVNGLALAVQEAWRSYHAGEFHRAVTLAEQCGLLAHACANKATGVHATYLLKAKAAQQAGFQSAVARAERAISLFADDANSHYFKAFNLGRYGQSISIVEALKRGMAGRIHKSLSRTLEIQPGHAEAHTAMGMYHAEIINKVGKMIGGMTYGASADKAVEHFRKALELTPEAPIARIEYGNGLYLLYGDRRLDEVTDLYVKASEIQPKDAMEKLDIEAALAELE